MENDKIIVYIPKFYDLKLFCVDDSLPEDMGIHDWVRNGEMYNGDEIVDRSCMGDDSPISFVISDRTGKRITPNSQMKAFKGERFIPMEFWKN